MTDLPRLEKKTKVYAVIKKKKKKVSAVFTGERILNCHGYFRLKELL